MADTEGQINPNRTTDKKETKREQKAKTKDGEPVEVVVVEPEEKFTLANCRFYEQKYPEVDDLVMVEVKSIEEMGAYVSLKEYNEIEGMVLLSELSRRRIRSINKIIRVGRLEVGVVLRVDKEKGYIDLSKRRVSEEDIVKCEEKYNKAKAVHSIMRHVAETTHTELETLYTKFGWPLYKKYVHAYDAFKLAITEPDKVLEGIDIDQSTREALLINIKRRLTPQPVKVRADVEVTCFQYEGIDAIRAALQKGEETSTELAPIKVKLVAPPLYVVTTTSIQKEAGIKAIDHAIGVIKEEITKRKGELTVKVPPRAVAEREDRELDQMMKKLQHENEEATTGNLSDEADEKAGGEDSGSEED